MDNLPQNTGHATWRGLVSTFFGRYVGYLFPPSPSYLQDTWPAHHDHFRANSSTTQWLFVSLIFLLSAA